MTEIFDDIPADVKERTEVAFELALKQHSFLSAVNVLKEYTETCINEREKEFAEFYFNMKMSQILNEE